MGDAEFPGSERFTLLRRLGEGRAGAVFQVQDEETSAVVALKVLRRVDPAASARVEALFRRMADVRHPNLVALHDFFRAGERCSFTMELVEGPDVLQYVAGGGRGRFDEIRLNAAMLGLAKGLTALHATSRAHGELKPSNVRVTPQGRVVLLESISSEAGAPAPAPGRYLAPEQWPPGAVGPPADWYAVGCLLYEALTGVPPFQGTPQEILAQKRQRRPPPPREVAPGAPEALEALCVELLDPAPERRPQDADVMAWLSGRKPRPRAQEPIPPPPAAAEAPASAAPREPEPPAPPERAPPRPQPQATPLALAPAPPTARAFAGVPGQPPFVGRRAELEALRELLARLEPGAPAAALLSGEAGIGKTALLGRFLLDAEKQGALCFTGRCYGRLALPFNAFAGIAAQLGAYLARRGSPLVEQVLPREAGALAAAFPELLQVPQLEALADRSPPPADPAGGREVAFAAVAELFTRLGQQQPVVLAMDDLHAADADSLDLLAAVLRAPGPTRLLVLGARRPRRGEPFSPQLDLPLGPLSAEESLELVRRMPLAPGMGPSTTPDGVARIGRGVPLFLVELLRQPAGAPASAAPSTVEEAVGARVAALEPDARRLLELVALAGDPIPAAAAARAAADTPDSIEPAEGYLPLVARLRELGLLEGTDPLVDVAHEKVREVAAARVKEADLPRRHALLARALSAERERGARAGLIASHLQRAGSADLAAEAWREAAGQAADRFAFKLAADLHRQGLTLTGQVQTRRSLQLGLAASLSALARPLEVADALLSASDGAAPAERARLRLAAAEHLLSGAQVAQALALHAELVPEEAPLLRAKPAAARRALAVQRLGLRVGGGRWKERPGGEAVAAEVLLGVEALRAVATALWPMEPSLGAALAARALRAALRLGDGRQVALALMLEAVFAGQQGNRRRVRALAGDALRAAGPAAAEPRVKGFLAGLEGVAAHHLGAFRQAEERLAELERLLDVVDFSPWHLGTFRTFRLWALRDAGRYAELSRWLERWLADASRRGDAFSQAALVRAGAVAWMARDDPQGALLGLEEARWPSPWAGYGALEWADLWARGNLALYAREGGGLRARFRQPLHAVPRWLVARNQLGRCRTWFLRGRFALMDASMNAEVRAAVAEAAQMARALEGENTAYAAAWALLLRAGVAYQKMDFNRSALRLREAVAQAEGAGMQQYALAGRRRLGEIIGGEEGAALIRQANDALGQLGVRNPKRLCDALVPGLRA